MVKISNGNIVIASYMEYKDTIHYVLKEEAVDFFLSPDFYSNLKIDPEACPFEMLDRALNRLSDLQLILRPKLHGYDTAPLWIYGGAHDYENPK